MAVWHVSQCQDGALSAPGLDIKHARAYLRALQAAVHARMACGLALYATVLYAISCLQMFIQNSPNHAFRGSTGLGRPRRAQWQAMYTCTW